MDCWGHINNKILVLNKNKCLVTLIRANDKTMKLNFLEKAILSPTTKFSTLEINKITPKVAI